MKKTAILLCSLSSALLLGSCNRENSDSVDQDKIYTEYRIVYDADKDITYARTTFRFSNATGTKLELSPPASIKFDGTDMPWKQALAYYESEFSGVNTGGTFSYSDHDNNTFTNVLSLTSSISTPAIDTISQAGSYTFIWVGDALQSNQIITVTIDGVNENDTKIFSTASVGASDIVLDQNKLQGIGVGTATVYIERYESYMFEDGTSAGGASWSRYIADPITVYIKN